MLSMKCCILEYSLTKNIYFLDFIVLQLNIIIDRLVNGEYVTEQHHTCRFLVKEVQDVWIRKVKIAINNTCRNDAYCQHVYHLKNPSFT